jgi:hypothetical protein
MDEVEFTIESLAIKIYTNIPDKQNQIVNFGRSMLYIPKPTNNDEVVEVESVALEELPFFTTDVEYPVDQLNRLDYQSRVNFFFNSSKFVDILRPYYVKEDNTALKLDKSTDDSYYEKRERRTRGNIMTMLEILFPTKFPVINDIQTSYDFLKDKQSTRPFWFNPFQTHYFSYLKIGGSTYTIKKTVWLNDMLNHPVYRKMIVEYRKVRKWADEQLYSKDSRFGNPAEQIKDIKTKIREELNKMSDIIAKLNVIADDYIKSLSKSAGGAPKAKTSGFKNITTAVNDANEQYTDIERVDDDEENESAIVAPAIALSDPDIKWIESDTTQIVTSPSSEITATSSPLKKQLREAFKAIKGYEASINRLKTSIENVKSYFKTTIAKSIGKTPSTTILRKFQAIMNEYKDPFRKSSNIYLQYLIDGLFTDDTAAEEYYKLLAAIYKKYIRGEGLDAEDEELLTGGTNEPKLVNVGISYINIGESNKPTREVYFMIDLVDGEINNENVSSIYCPFIGDYLGNQLEYLITESRNPLENKWAVDKNRQMFSLKKIEASIANNFSSNELSASESVPGRKIGPGQLIDNRQQPTRPIMSPVQNFMAYIMKDPTDLQKQLNELKSKYLDNDITSLDALRILDQIKEMKQSPFAKQLYEAIEGWNENMEIKNNKVINSLIAVINSIKSKKEMIANEKDSYATKNDPSKQRLLILTKEEDINNILAGIAEKVLAHEKTKRERITGGSTRKHVNRHRHEHKKNTKKHR